MKVPFSTYTTESCIKCFVVLAPYQAGISSPIEYRIVATDLPGFADTHPAIRIEPMDDSATRPGYEVYILNPDGSKPPREYAKGNYWDVCPARNIAKTVHDLVMLRFRATTRNAAWVHNVILTVTVMSTHPEIVK